MRKNNDHLYKTQSVRFGITKKNMFAKKVFESVETSLNGTIVIPIHIGNLFPVGTRFRDIETDPTIADQRGLSCNPNELMKVIYTIMHVVANPHFGCPATENANEDKRSHCFVKPNGTVADKVTTYLEFVHNLNGKREGWRLYIVTCDPTFNMDMGLTKFFEYERKRIKEASKAPSTIASRKENIVAIKAFSNKTKWITNGINPYLGEILELPTEDQDFNTDGNQARHFDLYDPANPANTSRVFTFARSCEAFPNAAPDYLNEQLYISAANAEEESESSDDDDESDDEGRNMLLHRGARINLNVAAKRISFPHGAYLIPHANRDPVVFFSLHVDKEPNDDELVATSQAVRDNRWKTQEIKDQTASTDHVVDSAREWWVEMTNEKDPKEISAIRESEIATDMFMSACRNIHSNPGSIACTSWLIEKMRRDPTWSPCPIPEPIMDPTLTPFGNRMASEMYRLELVAGLTVLQVELMLLLLVTLVVTDVNHDDMMCHIILHGPPGSGKSHLHQLLLKLSIPDMVYRIGTQSAKANTTNLNRNGMIAILDELNSMYAGKGVDGTGDALLKELMTRGRSKDAMCWVEDGEKKEVVTNIEKKSTVIANTNLSESDLPEAIADRAYTRPVPLQGRGEIDTVSENYKMRSDPERTAAVTKVATKWQFMQSVSAMVFVKILINQFPQIDMQLTTKIAAHVFQVLQNELGSDVDFRDKERIMWITKTCILYDAISEVWYSGNVVPPGTPFSMSQINLLLPYLTGRREHFLFALTIMDDLVVDPSLSVILSTFQSMVLDEPNMEKRFGRSVNNNRVNKPDYNYYAIQINSVGVHEHTNSVIYQASRIIADTIKSTTPHEFTHTHIASVIKRLMTQKKSVFPYIDATNKDMSCTQRISLMDIKKTSSGYSVEICRHFMQSVVIDKQDILKDAVLSAVDRNFPHDKIITGRSFRYGYQTSQDAKPQSFPFVLQVVDATAQREKDIPIYLEKDKYRRFASDYILNGGEIEDIGDIEERYEKSNSVLEDKFAGKWCTTIGARLPPKHDHSKRRGVGIYPEAIIEGYNQEFRHTRKDMVKKRVIDAAAAAPSRKKKKKMVVSDDEEEEALL